MRVAACALAGQQIDADCALGRGIADGIDACATQQRIRTGTANQEIIAQTAVEHVIAGITGQLVVERGSGQVLDRVEDIASRFTGVGGRCSEADIDCSTGIGITGRVAACTTRQRVAAGHALQRVIAIATLKCVGTGITGQQVGVGRACEVFEIKQHIAGGIA